MPAVQRERVAGILTDPQSVKEIGLCRARAVQEMTKQPGASWASVAATIGASEATVNRLVTIARKAGAATPE
jgi:DNA-binding transcriptional regulator LsrR (DeoR family)